MFYLPNSSSSSKGFPKNLWDHSCKRDFFADQMPLLSPDQQCKSTDAKRKHVVKNLFTNKFDSFCLLQWIQLPATMQQPYCKINRVYINANTATCILPSRKASLPIRWYQIILLADRSTCVLTTCPGLHYTAGRPGFEPATYWSQVQRPNHSATHSDYVKTCR